MLAEEVVISIVDDDESVRNATRKLISSVGLKAVAFSSAEEFLNAGGQKGSSCLILDLRLPGKSGLELQTELVASGSKVPIIFTSARGDGYARSRALAGGAIDFLQKPFSEQSLFKAIGASVGKPVDVQSESRPRGNYPGRITFDQIVAQSPVMRETLRLARKVAESEVSSVLLQGQSGTGKDLVAKAIHYASRRADYPFVAINCAALPPNLIESELFGHEKGAFTDARTRKEGLLEQDGGGGTIFLDEISEMELNLQAKLLRVLEEGSFRRVGGVKDIPFSSRVIAASNRDLRRETDAGRFRADLYYRLAVIQIDIPPLSDRGDDILLLAHHFIKQFANRRIEGLTSDVVRALTLYEWPGNVRELRNVIEGAIVLEDGNMISTRYLPRDIVPDSRASGDFIKSVNVVDRDGLITLPIAGIPLCEVETSLLRQALARASGNQTRAAELLGLTRDQFRYRMKKLRGANLPRPIGA